MFSYDKKITVKKTDGVCITEILLKVYSIIRFLNVNKKQYYLIIF